MISIIRSWSTKIIYNLYKVSVGYIEVLMWSCVLCVACVSDCGQCYVLLVGLSSHAC